MFGLQLLSSHEFNSTCVSWKLGKTHLKEGLYIKKKEKLVDKASSEQRKCKLMNERLAMQVTSGGWGERPREEDGEEEKGRTKATPVFLLFLFHSIASTSSWLLTLLSILSQALGPPRLSRSNSDFVLLKVFLLPFFRPNSTNLTNYFRPFDWLTLLRQQQQQRQKQQHQHHHHHHHHQQQQQHK